MSIMKIATSAAVATLFATASFAGSLTDGTKIVKPVDQAAGAVATQVETGAIIAGVTVVTVGAIVASTTTN